MAEWCTGDWWIGYSLTHMHRVKSILHFAFYILTFAFLDAILRKEQKVIRVVPLRYDTVFKKAFGKPEVFCQFVKDVLGVEIHVERVIPGWRYPEPVGFVDIEYDLFAEDTQKRIIVELQHVREEDLFDRFLYYHLIALVEQVKSYANQG